VSYSLLWAGGAEAHASTDASTTRPDTSAKAIANSSAYTSAKAIANASADASAETQRAQVDQLLLG